VSDWEPDEFSDSKLTGCNYAMHEVTHYELIFGDKELFYYNWWERTFRRNGVDPWAKLKETLGG